VARVGRGDGRTLVVEFLEGAESPGIRHELERQLDFYIREHEDKDKWAYLVYHATRTGANVYSRVHWSYHPADKEESMTDPEFIQELKDAYCWFDVDRVPHDPAMTEFRRRARLHQARWREKRGLKMGGHLQHDGETRVPVGSRLDLEEAKATGANFLNDRIREAVKHRVDNPERHQMLHEERLWSDLLSSMPMCFNIFGDLRSAPADATKALHAWLPDVDGEVEELLFEWSPGRGDPSYLGNRAAFDAALILNRGDAGKGVVGVETKYHEYAKAEGWPDDDKLAHYAVVSELSNVFKPGWKEAIVGTDLQQIWLDHLLVLSMLQNDEDPTTRGRFLLIYPDKNPSFRGASERYRDLLEDDSTFVTRTVEELLDANVLPGQLQEDFRERYLW
jgi:hypothetical protein